MRTYVNVNKVIGTIGAIAAAGATIYFAVKASKEEKRIAEEKKILLDEDRYTVEIREASMKNPRLTPDQRIIANLELNELYSNAKYACSLEFCKTELAKVDLAIEDYKSGTGEDIAARATMYEMIREERIKTAEIASKNRHEMDMVRYKSDSSVINSKIIANTIKDVTRQLTRYNTDSIVADVIDKMNH